MNQVILTIVSLSSAIVLAVAGIVFISVIAAIPTFFLWNFLMPVIFGLTKITFIQAIAINMLCECIFKSRNTVSSSKSD